MRMNDAKREQKKYCRWFTSCLVAVVCSFFRVLFCVAANDDDDNDTNI